MALRNTGQYKPESRWAASVERKWLHLTSSKFVDQVLQSVQVSRLLCRYILVCMDASRDATAMKCEFTRQLIETHTRAPTSYAPPRQSAERRTHPSSNRTELLVFLVCQHSTFEIRNQKLPDHLSFASQCERDHDEDDDERRNHHNQISDHEKIAAAKHRGTVPDAVHEDGHQQADYRRQ